MNYVATFYTHLAALRSKRNLDRRGIPARLAPVPRALSSSCGTCVLYEGEDPCLDAMDGDTEGVYAREGGGYRTITEY